MLPNQQAIFEIASGWQPELKTHVLNVQKAVQRVLRNRGDSADVAKRAGEMFDSINEKLYKRDPLDETEKRVLNIVCKAGCAYCCCIPVNTFQHEIDLIARELKAKLTSEELTALKGRMQNVIDEREKGKRPRCALLGPDNLCSVYSVRPLYCRSCNSPDVDECISYEETGDETPRQTFIVPSIFADHTHFAANTTMNPDLTPHTYPVAGELMEMLVKAL